MNVSKKLGPGGFGLIEILIAMGLFAIMAAAASNLVVTNLQASKSFEKTVALDQAVQEATAALSYPNVCTSNIGQFAPSQININGGAQQLAATSIKVNQISISSGALFSNGGALPNHPTTTLNLSLTNFRNLATQTYLADLVFSLNKGASAIGGATISRKAAIVINTDAGGNFTACSSVATNNGANAPANLNAAELTQICSMIGQSYSVATNQCQPVAAACQGYTATCNNVPVSIASTASGSTFSLNNSPMIYQNQNYTCSANAACTNSQWSNVTCSCSHSGGGGGHDD